MRVLGPDLLAAVRFAVLAQPLDQALAGQRVGQGARVAVGHKRIALARACRAPSRGDQRHGSAATRLPLGLLAVREPWGRPEGCEVVTFGGLMRTLR